LHLPKAFIFDVDVHPSPWLLICPIVSHSFDLIKLLYLPCSAASQPLIVSKISWRPSLSFLSSPNASTECPTFQSTATTPHISGFPYSSTCLALSASTRGGSETAPVLFCHANQHEPDLGQPSDHSSRW
jgi:hypothetical protein